MTTKRNWFGEYRLAWITETLQIFGFINQRHLKRKFGISMAQCSNDFRKFNKRNPLAMTYIPSERRYVANEMPE